jgi:hypothetical protein
MKTLYAAYVAVAGFFFICDKPSDHHKKFLRSLARNEKTQSDVASESEDLLKAIRENERSSGVRSAVESESKRF